MIMPAMTLSAPDRFHERRFRPASDLRSPSVTAMGLCPSCGSSLLQPLRSTPQGDGRITVELRCPECFTWLQERCTRDELAELDKTQAALRDQLVDAYERSVVESMEALAICLGAALDRDLVGPDDFALSRPRPPAGSSPRPRR
jgi:hypothetical protein